MRSLIRGREKLVSSIAALLLSASLLLLTSHWVSAARPLQTSRPPTPVPTRTPLSSEQLKMGGELPRGAPVTINNQTLFRLQSRVGSISPAERASIVSGHINSLITNPFISVSALDLVDSLDTTDIMAGDQVLVSVTDADAAAAGRDRYELAVAWQLNIEKVIREGKAAYTIRSIILGVIEALVACVVLVILVRWTNRLYRRATLALESGPSDQVPGGQCAS